MNLYVSTRTQESEVFHDSPILSQKCTVAARSDDALRHFTHIQKPGSSSATLLP